MATDDDGADDDDDDSRILESPPLLPLQHPREGQ